jgi:uncharacterized protein (DUF302 family)
LAAASIRASPTTAVITSTSEQVLSCRTSAPSSTVERPTVAGIGSERDHMGSARPLSGRTVDASADEMTEPVLYGFSIRVDQPLAEAERRLREALAREGFGVLTELDVQEAMKEELGADFPPYRVLGACNPQLVLQTLSVEPAIGLLLPCSVVLTERDGATILSFLDPEAAMGRVDNPAVTPAAHEAAERLRRVASGLAGPF